MINYLTLFTQNSRKLFDNDIKICLDIVAQDVLHNIF